MFNTNGTSIIEKALSQFDTVKAKLAEGVAKCLATQSENQQAIAKLEAENKGLSESADKANRAIRGIEKLLSGE